MENSKALKDRLLKYRTEEGLSQEKFAHLLGISFVTLNRWENGHSNPRGLQKKRVERMLNSKAKKTKK